MNIKKYILIGGALAVMASGVMYLPLANAEQTTNQGVVTQPDGTMVKPDGTMVKPDGTMIKPDGTMIKPDGTMIKPDGTMVAPDGRAGTTARPMVLQVGPNGKVLMRGKVKSVSDSSLVVKSWGGDWTVKLTASAAILPQGMVLSQLKADDFVGVQGWVHTTESFTIEADLVRNWTERAEIQANRQEVRDIVKDLTPRNWQGTAKSVASDSFVLTVDGVDYTVALAAGAKVYNRQYVEMSFADIKVGHTVRFYGTVSGTTATAYVVRDISVGL